MNWKVSSKFSFLSSRNNWKMKLLVVLALFPCFVLGSESDNNLRIHGGKDAVQEQFPYQISIRLPKYEYRHHCGGSILNSKWILTAAHCVHYGAPSDFVVYSGSVLLSSGGTNHAVAKIIPHANYSGDRMVKNDVALLKLEDEIKLSERAAPIELQTAELVDEVDAVVSGWGKDAEGRTPNNLQYLQVRTITIAKCEAVIGDFSPNQICAKGTSGKGICQSDSGGPLVANGKQIGIVSWSPSGCGDGSPAVYAEVSSFVDWIEEKMAG